MANEIYCNTWWGDTPKTALSLVGACENVQGQIEMYKRAVSENATIEDTLCAADEFYKIANI